MADKTFRVVRSAGGWAVKRFGRKAPIFPSQSKEVQAARAKAKSQREAQVIVHKQDGRLVIKEVRGLPVVQKPPQKSSIGTIRISKVISRAIQKRLETA